MKIIQRSSDNDNSEFFKDIVLFQHEDFGNLRTIVVDGQPAICGLDLCRILEIENNRDAIRSLDSDEKITVLNPDGNPRAGIPHQLVYLFEPGVYQVIFKSRKSEAKKVQRWVAHDILPTLRKTGTYSIVPQPPSRLDEIKMQIRQMGIQSLLSLSEMEVYPESQRTLFKAEAAALSLDRDLTEYLPPVPEGRDRWLTPTQLAQRYGVPPQKIGHILKNYGLHGNDDHNGNHSEPYWNKALHCERQVISYKYDPKVVCPVLDRALFNDF
jgi:prophage antirepressor-like protein